jgi:6-phosphogluconolactonase
MRLDYAAEGSIVAYSIDDANGGLTLVEQYGSRGVAPRQFSLSPEGTLLAVGNQNSNTLVLFAVDPDTGRLDFLDDRDVCASPRFARFATIQ